MARSKYNQQVADAVFSSPFSKLPTPIPRDSEATEEANAAPAESPMQPAAPAEPVQEAFQDQGEKEQGETEDAAEAAPQKAVRRGRRPRSDTASLRINLPLRKDKQAMGDINIRGATLEQRERLHVLARAYGMKMNGLMLKVIESLLEEQADIIDEQLAKAGKK